MRKFLFATILAFPLMAVSCTPTDINALIAQVQAQTATICSYVPTIATITAIIGLNNASLATALEIATSICAAVAKDAANKTAGERAAPNVHGVPVNGYFIR